MTDVCIFTSLSLCHHYQTAVTSEAKSLVGVTALTFQCQIHSSLTPENVEFLFSQMCRCEDCGNKLEKIHAGLWEHVNVTSDQTLDLLAMEQLHLSDTHVAPVLIFLLHICY